jgi:hypothetical protein
MALGSLEIMVIVGAIIFLFGGKKSLDWVKQFSHAKKTVQAELASEDIPKTKKKSKT